MVDLIACETDFSDEESTGFNLDIFFYRFGANFFIVWLSRDERIWIYGTRILEQHPELVRWGVVIV